FLLDGYGIDAYGLGLEVLTGVIVGSEIGEPQVYFPPQRKERRWRWHLRVPEFKVEAVLAFTNLVIKSLRNPLSKHLVFEEPKLDREGPDKLVVGKQRVGKQVLNGSCYPDSDFGLE
nr:hypothetical protein [Tanacetum cinerariifolium]